METDEFPVAFEDMIANDGTAADFRQLSEGYACCSTPVSPHTNDSLILGKNCESKLHQEKHAQHDSETYETPLQSTDVSLTMSDDGNENPVCLQLDEETHPDIEGELSRNDSELFNHGLSNEEEPRPMGNRILKFVKRVLKACGYVVGAVIGVPLIAGKMILKFIRLFFSCIFKQEFKNSLVFGYVLYRVIIKIIRTTFFVVNLSHVALIQHVSQSCKFYLCNILCATKAFQLAIIQFKMFCFYFLEGDYMFCAK